LLPLDYGEIDDPTGLAEDATEWKFLSYAQYEGGVVLKVSDCHDINRAMPIIRQAHASASVPPG
jgi:inorganic pyrophosphatase